MVPYDVLFYIFIGVTDDDMLNVEIFEMETMMHAYEIFEMETIIAFYH